MIVIDMPMPTNCLDCPACNEYLMCAIPANGKGLGENDVREYGQSRPEWCPLKEITLCKDCKQSGIDSTGHPRYWCSAHSEYHDGDWFCAGGKQKEGR